MPEHHPPYTSLCIEFTAFKGQKNLRLFELNELERNTNYNIRTDTYPRIQAQTDCTIKPSNGKTSWKIIEIQPRDIRTNLAIIAIQEEVKIVGH